MAADFLDTSALATNYHAEAGTPEVDRLWDEPGHGLYISRLAVVEMISVFARKVREGNISADDFTTMRKRFLADLAKRQRLNGVRLLVAHFQAADRLLCERGMVHRLRKLDALLLAVALDLLRRKLIERLVLYHKVLLNVAAVEGLMVFDPENP